MSDHVYKHVELTGSSKVGIEDAVGNAIARASKTLRNVRGAWVKENHVRCDSSGKITEYQVNMMVTFVLDD